VVYFQAVVQATTLLGLRLFQPANMPGLLDLPSELLFEIIRLVDSPSYPPNADCKRYRPARLQSRAVVCFPITEPSWPSRTQRLLLVCQRLRSEAGIYLSKVPQRFELDIALVNNHWIWPTWRLTPGVKLGNSLDSLQINIIDCCTEDDRASFALESMTAVTPLEILKVITHFLRCGATSAEFESSRILRGRSGFRIKTLVFNVDTAATRHGNRALSDNDVPFRKVQGLGHLTFDPLYPLDTATNLAHLDLLADLIIEAIPRESVCAALRERVDRVVFCADGLVRSEMNVADYLTGKEESRIEDYKRRNL
jgi:hypothetical protein